MKTKALFLGLGLTVSGFAGVLLPATGAFADTTNTCTIPYCVPPPTEGSGGGAPPVVTKSDGAVTTPSSGALAFTGADIEGLAVIGGGSLLVGGALLRRSRRRRAAA
ncbi:MAG TPA: hypothetical protein VED63_09435 [Acidimicrobiales bacterium]|nr:hypothetical protein [Acidimicrobiales bacterium]